jgi:hypothetical protein
LTAKVIPLQIKAAWAPDIDTMTSLGAQQVQICAVSLTQQIESDHWPETKVGSCLPIGAIIIFI